MGKKILVVDDEPDIIAVMKFTLEKNNFEVITAYNGEEGIEKARQSNPDLIVLDVLMPRMSGDATGSQLAAYPETCGIPIIFLTNVPLDFVTPANATEVGGLQQDDRGNIFLPKMSSEEVFMKAVHTLLGTTGQNTVKGDS